MTTAPVLDGLTRPDQLAQLPDAVRDRAAAVADLFERVTDPESTVAGTPDWPVIELIRHVTSMPGYYADVSGGGADRFATSVAGIDEISAQARSHLSEATPAECAQILRDDVETLISAVAASNPAERLPFQVGTRVSLAEQAGIALGEFLVHGLDLARSLGAAWAIDPDHAALVFAATQPILGAFTSPAAAGHSGTYEFRLRGGRGVARWRFTDGELDTTATDPFRPDVVVWADPAVLIPVFYGRRSQWGAIARGSMFAFGRKPWRAFTLVNRVQAP